MNIAFIVNKRFSLRAPDIISELRLGLEIYHFCFLFLFFDWWHKKAWKFQILNLIWNGLIAVTLPTHRLVWSEGNLLLKSTNGVVGSFFLISDQYLALHKNLNFKFDCKANLEIFNLVWKKLGDVVCLRMFYLFIYGIHTFPFCKETRSSSSIPFWRR